MLSGTFRSTAPRARAFASGTSRRAFSLRVTGVEGRKIGENALEVTLKTNQDDQSQKYSAIVREKNPDRAVEALEVEISPKIGALDPTDQRGIDNLLCSLDGTEDRSEFTPGAILGVSVAVAKLGAGASGRKLAGYLATIGKQDSLQMPMPIGILPELPMVSIIPFGDACFRDGIKRFQNLTENLSINEDQTKSLKAQLRALMRPLKTNDMLGEVALGVHLDRIEDREQLVEFMNKFPVALLQMNDVDPEEGLALTLAVGEHLQICGGKSLYNSVDTIRATLDSGIVNSAVIDINSLGTVTAAFDAFDAVREFEGVASMIWNAEKESEDMQEFLAHLALSQSVAAVSVADFEGPFAKHLCELEAILDGR